MIQNCEICTLSRDDHQSPNIHHLFSTDGKLVPKKVEKPKPANAAAHFVVGPEQVTAARLAAILHNRGIINDTDLVYVLMGGQDGSNLASRPSTGGDLSTRART